MSAEPAVLLSSGLAWASSWGHWAWSQESGCNQKKASCAQLQNRLLITSVIFHWAKQAIKPVQSQGWGNRFTKSHHKGKIVRFILNILFWDTNKDGVL